MARVPPTRFSFAKYGIWWMLSMFVLLFAIGFSDVRAAPSADASTSKVSAALDLPALARAAVSHYPGLRINEHQIRAARARLNEVRFSPYSQFMGRVNFGLAPGARGTPIFSPDGQLPVSNRWKPVVGLEISGAIPLYTFGKLKHARGAAKAGISGAQYEKEVTLARVIFDVTRAYFALQLSLDTLQMIDEGKGKLERALEKIKELLEEDDPDVNQTDRWRLATAVAEVRARESQALELENKSRAALQTLTGIKRVTVPECPLEQVTTEIAKLEAQQQAATDHRPEIGQLKAAKRARKAAVKGNKGRFAPDILLGLAAAYSRAPGITDIENPFIADAGNNRRFSIGLQARWSLDFVGSVYRTRRAEAELAALKEQHNMAIDGILFEVETIYAHLIDARRRVEAWSEGHREARSWFVAAAQGYEVGTTEPKELIDAVKNYFAARFEHTSAIADYNVTLGALEKATGVALVDEAGWRTSCSE